MVNMCPRTHAPSTAFPVVADPQDSLGLSCRLFSHPPLPATLSTVTHDSEHQDGSMPSFTLTFFRLERCTVRRHIPGACFFGMTPNGLHCTQVATSAGRGPIALPSEISSWRYCVTTSAF